MFDTIIRDGFVIDGTGAAGINADIGISGGKIAAVGNLKQDEAAKVIQAEGYCVCPGFIDAHCHTDMYASAYPGAEGKIMQGVTTDVCGLCGTSPVPDHYEKDHSDPRRMFGGYEAHSFREYVESINRQGNTTNMACFIGNGSLRKAVSALAARPASLKELDQMKTLLAQCLQEGAWGLSTGLTYVPSQYASEEELILLSAVAANYGGIYNSHMRNEGLKVMDAIKEVIQIAQSAGIQGHISHLKISDQKNHGKADQCLELIHQANERGTKVGFDIYPYTAGSTSLDSLLPPEARGYEYGGGIERIPESYMENLRLRLADDSWDNLVLSCGWDNLMVGAAENADEYAGVSIGSIGRQMGVPPFHALLTVLEKSQNKASMVYHCMTEEDVKTFLKDPGCMIGTDGYARHYTGFTAEGKPHPRNYGAFPRFLRNYVLDQKLMSLEEGIRRITSLPADTFHLTGRGRILPGYTADITIFNADTIRESGSYDNPAQKPKGIEWVLVAGRAGVARETFCDIRAGRMLLHNPR